MWRTLHLLKLISLGLCGIILAVAFENCSPIGPKSGGVDGMSTGGVDGMRYDHAAKCSDGTGIRDSVMVSKDLQTAAYIRQNCADLSTPVPVQTESLKFAVNEKSVFVLNEGIYAIGKDGSKEAPSGNPQLSNLLASYAVRPGWKVAGVDYAVGPAAGTQFKDPLTISIPGVTVDQNAHEIVINADNVTLDGYDFSMEGGWTVTVGEQRPAANTKVLNSKFMVGSNKNNMLTGADFSSNLYVGNCIFDGNATPDNLDSSAIFFSGNGLTVEYSWLKNIPKSFIEAGAGTIVIRYNLFHNNNRVINSAGVWLQLGDGDHYLVSDYNTFYQTAVPSNYDTTGGIDVQSDVGGVWSIQSSEVLNNTIVTMSGAKIQDDVLIDISHLAGTSIVRDNFVDPSGSLDFAAPGSSCALGTCPASAKASSLFTNNINMVTGVPFSDTP